MINPKGKKLVDPTEILEQLHLGKLVHYKKGQILYSQGDPLKFIILIKAGKVKIYSLSVDGKIYTYRIHGSLQIMGDVALLLNGIHKSTCEAIEDVSAYLISPEEFETLLNLSPSFSRFVMVELAQSVRMYAREAEYLGIENVEKRLRYTLIRLANEYGRNVDEGTMINLRLTHEELAELIGARRSTVTSLIKKLSREGFLKVISHYFILLSKENLD